MVSYEAYESDLEVAPTRTAIDKIRTHTAAELDTENADPSYATVACEAAEQTPLTASVIRITFIRSVAGAELETVNADPIYATVPCVAAEQTPLTASVIHITYIRSWEGVSFLFLYGLPASTFGYVRPIKIFRKGRPVPFMTTVLDAALPTGLITSVVGKSSTVVQSLKYVVRGRKHDQEYESDEIDLTGAEVPPLIEVTIRRKTSAKLNRKKMR